jgi:hypothetical protein
VTGNLEPNTQGEPRDVTGICTPGCQIHGYFSDAHSIILSPHCRYETLVR